MLKKEMLRELRKSKGYTGQQVADELGISYKVYQTYESGARNAGLPVVEKLADFYGVTTDYLLGREDKNDPIANIAAQYGLSDAAKAVLAAYLYMNDSERAALLSTVKRFADAAEQPNRPTMTIKKHINKAAAGSGYNLTDDDEFEDITIIRTDEAERADFAVEVDGDSMTPTYNDGDIVLIQLTPDISVGEVGLFVQNGKGYIKRKGEKYLISDNTAYPNIYPKDGEITAVGRVIGIAETKRR